MLRTTQGAALHLRHVVVVGAVCIFALSGLVGSGHASSKLALGSTASRASGISVTLVDTTQTSEAVSGSPQAAAPGSVVALKVTATLAGGDKWYSTSWAIGDGKVTCFDTPNHSGSGSATEYVNSVTLPELTPSPASVTVTLYPAAACSGAALGTATHPFVISPVTRNPTLAPSCDTRVVLVLDESYSVHQTSGAETGVRDGARAFMNGLVGSGAEVAVIEFNSQARTVSLGPTAYNAVTSTFVSGSFERYISGSGPGETYSPGSYSSPNYYTNWDDAFVKAQALAPKPQLVVFLTDGDPTARNITTSPGFQTGFTNGSYAALNPAFNDANAVKASGTHIFVIGVGAALTSSDSQVRLRAISGSVQFPQNNLLGSDYTLITNFSQLQEALSQIGYALCSVQVHVTKLVDDTGGDNYAAQNGWSFTGNVTVSGSSNDSYRWLLPGTATGPPSGGNTRTGTTATTLSGDGNASFVWLPSPTNLTSSIVLTDVGKNGYHFKSVTCTKDGKPLTVANAATITLSNLANNDDVSCVFKNQKDPALVPGIDVAKSADPATYGATGQTITYTYKVTNSGNVPLSGVALSDSRLGAITCPKPSLAVGESMTCTATHVTTTADVKAGHVDNTATVTGQPPTGNPVTDSSSATVTLVQAPGISVAKSADPVTFGKPGQTITYTYVVSNAGNVPLSGVALSDSKLGTIVCPQTSLDVGESMTCTATHVTTAADVQALNIDNLATVLGKAPDGKVVEGSDTASVTFVAAPGISVAKSAEPDTFGKPGQTITYTYVVTNSGNVPLSAITLSDSELGTIVCPTTTLDAGESMECEAVHVTTPADVKAGHITNAATVEGKAPDGKEVDASDTATVTFIPAPGISVAKSAEPDTFGKPGQTITYTYVVTNSGNVPLSAITLSDSELGTIVCPTTTLDAGESMECEAVHVTTPADVKAGHITNAATVEGKAPDGKEVDASDTATVTFIPAPGISVAKSAEPDTFGKPGQTITYTYVVTNSGNVPLSAITLSDSELGTIVCPTTTLDAGESMECEAVHVTTPADVKAGHITNAATVEGKAPDGKEVDASDTATVTFIPAPGISVAKSAEPDTFGKPGQTITYTYVVTNSGNVPLSAITLSDSELGTIVCPTTTLDAGESMECEAVHVTTPADVKAGHITNAATVEGKAPDGKEVDASDTATVTFIPAPGISVAKSAEPDTFGKPGQTITYTYVVTNSGNVPLSAITLSDSELGTIICPTTTLDAGESMECEAVHVTTPADVKAGHITNAATVEGKAPDGKEVDASDTATVTFIPAPGISVAKSAEPDTFGKPGQTITYTYVVTNSGNVPLSAITLSDSELGTIVCPTTTLDAGESMECEAVHVTTPADVKAGHITNAATVEGKAPDGKEVDASDTATVTFIPAPGISVAKSAEPDTFGKPGQTITYTYVVTNSGNVPLSAITLSDSELGTIVCPTTTLDAGESMECEAVHVTTPADVKAGHITNAATVEGKAPDGKEVDASDTATVTFIPAPGISVAKSAEPDTFGKPGQTITYTYVVTNSGNVPLSAITLSDSELGTIVCPTTTLDAGESMECEAVHVTTPADVKAGHITNAATVEGKAPDGKEVDASDTATVTFIPAPGISVAKSAEPDTFGKPGQTITYTYVVTNSGNVPLSAITLSDSELGTIVCPTTTLDAGESMECEAVHVTTPADVKAGHITNAATVEGKAPDGKEVDASDTATVTFIPAPGISVAKSAEPDTFGKPGQTITYTYVVTNSGNVPLSAITLSDSELGTIVCPTTTLDAGESMECEAVHVTTPADVKAGHITNAATVEGKAPDGKEVDASDTATVTFIPAPGISVAKSAEPSTYGVAGQTITYTYLVTNSGNVPLSRITPTDSKLGTITCPTTSLDAAASMTCTATHVTTAADLQAGHITNAATVKGTAPDGKGVDASDTATVTVVNAPAISVAKTAAPSTYVASGETITYTYVVTNSGNVTLSRIALTDSKLGTIRCPATLLAAGASMRCRATHVTTAADVQAGHITNAATATGHPPTGARVSDSTAASATAQPFNGIPPFAG